MNLKGSVVLYKLSKIIVTDSPLEPKTPPATESWLDFSIPGMHSLLRSRLCFQTKSALLSM